VQQDPILTFMRKARGQSDEVEEALRDLEEYLSRLRVAYEQYFAGALKREPQDLRARVQRIVTRFVNDAPRNSGQKFRFNQLNARYQAYRQLWGRILREIEAGTYRPHRFRAALHTREPTAPAAEHAETGAQESSEAEKLAQALATARGMTGEDTEASSEKLVKLVRKQIGAIRERYGEAKVRFKVVIEDNRAKLKASVPKS
jgi:hypothetical protein